MRGWEVYCLTAWPLSVTTYHTAHHCPLLPTIRYHSILLPATTPRSVHELVRVGSVEPEVGFYMNRLSDYLFMAARAAAQQNGHPEILWKKVQSTRPPATEEA